MAQRQPTSIQPPAFDLSVVIPAHNEARRLPRTLAAAAKCAARLGEAWELIVVDDGSTDGTAGLADAPAAEGVTLVWLRHERRLGKGRSVADGVLAARGGQVLMTDADLSAPIDQIDILRQALADGANIAIGSRDLPGSQLNPPQPMLRRRMGAGLRAIRRRLLLPDLRDTQCGFKLFTAEAGRAVFEQVRCAGYAFDIEALVLARRLGFGIEEVPILWRNDPDSRVRPLRDGLGMLLDVLAIRRRVRPR